MINEKMLKEELSFSRRCLNCLESDIQVLKSLLICIACGDNDTAISLLKNYQIFAYDKLVDENYEVIKKFLEKE